MPPHAKLNLKRERERERKKPTLSLPSSSLCHQPSFSPLFALVPLPHCWCLQEDLSHYMCFQIVQCSLPLLQALFAFLYPFSARVTHHHSNVLLCKTATLCLEFVCFFLKGRINIIGLLQSDCELLWLMPSHFPLCCLLFTHVLIAGVSVSKVKSLLSCEGRSLQPRTERATK